MTPTGFAGVVCCCLPSILTTDRPLDYYVLDLLVVDFVDIAAAAAAAAAVAANRRHTIRTCSFVRREALGCSRIITLLKELSPIRPNL